MSALHKQALAYPRGSVERRELDDRYAKAARELDMFIAYAGPIGGAPSRYTWTRDERAEVGRKIREIRRRIAAGEMEDPELI